MIITDGLNFFDAAQIQNGKTAGSKKGNLFGMKKADFGTKTGSDGGGFITIL